MRERAYFFDCDSSRLAVSCWAWRFSAFFFFITPRKPTGASRTAWGSGGGAARAASAAVWALPAARGAEGVRAGGTPRTEGGPPRAAAEAPRGAGPRTGRPSARLRAARAAVKAAASSGGRKSSRFTTPREVLRISSGVSAVAEVEEALHHQRGVGARREGEGDVHLGVPAVHLVRLGAAEHQLVREREDGALLVLEVEQLGRVLDD